MKIIFAGTPEFSAVALQKIVDAGFDVCVVLTQPDRPKGRGLKLVASPVKELAQELNIPILQPQTLKTAEIQQLLRSYQADVMVVAAYGLLLPQAVLDIPRMGCLNIHASLLPRWRGAAPIQRAIEAGDTQTGVCIMQMDEGLDTGDVLMQEVCAINEDDTALSIHDKLKDIGANLIVASLQQYGQLSPLKQTDIGVTYAKKLSKEEAKIDWSEDAFKLSCKIRALNPVPGAWTLWQGQVLKIWFAQQVWCNVEAVCGEIVGIEGGVLLVKTGSECVHILQLQLAGGKKLTAEQFLSGHKMQVGDLLGELI